MKRISEADRHLESQMEVLREWLSLEQGQHDEDLPEVSWRRNQSDQWIPYISTAHLDLLQNKAFLKGVVEEKAKREQKQK